jgi:hypothetical protein
MLEPILLSRSVECRKIQRRFESRPSAACASSLRGPGSTVGQNRLAWIDGAGFVVNTRSLITYCLHPSTGHGMAERAAMIV